MKTDEFKKLIDFCEENGFEVNPAQDHCLLITKKKDIWDNIEYAESLIKSTNQYSIGRIYKINDVNQFNLKNYFKPSTEQAYVEQLKKEAFERFGKIKQGDRFDLTEVGYSSKSNISIPDNEIGFIYNKNIDLLRFNDVIIYKQGKWAKRLHERVEVEGYSSNGSQDINIKTDWSYNFLFKLKNYHKNRFGAGFMYGKALPFLAEQLEKYLNGEVE